MISEQGYHHQDYYSSKLTNKQRSRFLAPPKYPGFRHYKQYQNSYRPPFQTHFTNRLKEIGKMDKEYVLQNVKKENFDTCDVKVSATTKALNKIEENERKPKLARLGKISNKLKRKKINEKLAKLLTPKNALLILNEMKPGCVFTTKETPHLGNLKCHGFTIEVKDGENILGTGQAFSKSQAKSLAAENAIKTLFLKAMKSILAGGQPCSEDGLSDFPWTGLAQFAMYKMFSEWQLQDSDFPSSGILKFMNFAKGSKTTPNVPQPKRQIPPNASKLHPTCVLNNLHPDLVCIELERTVGPPSRVKVAYEVDGKQFCGVAPNKKEAKKEAAKQLLSTVYGVEYNLY